MVSAPAQEHPARHCAYACQIVSAPAQEHPLSTAHTCLPNGKRDGSGPVQEHPLSVRACLSTCCSYCAACCSLPSSGLRPIMALVDRYLRAGGGQTRTSSRGSRTDWSFWRSAGLPLLGVCALHTCLPNGKSSGPRAERPLSTAHRLKEAESVKLVRVAQALSKTRCLVVALCKRIMSSWIANKDHSE